MRILHAVHDYLPDQVAGVEVYTNRIASRLAGQHAVGILYAVQSRSRSTGSVETSEEGAVELYALSQQRDWTRFEQSWNDPRVTAGVREVLDAFDPDVIHIQHLMNLGVAWLEEVERREIPMVMTLHDQWWACAAGGQRFRSDRERCDDLVASRCATCTATSVGPALLLRQRLQQRRRLDRERGGGSEMRHEAGARTLPRRAAESAWARLVGLGGPSHIEARWAGMRRLGERVDAFIAPSDEIRAAAIDFGLPADRIVRVPHGLPDRASAVSPLPERILRFGYVGSIVPHKGVHHLIEAFGQLPAEASLDLVGSLHDSPDYVAELRGLIRHPGIRLLGERSPSEVPALLDSVEAIVAPSIWRENAPLSIQEAFVAGRPVIASDLGGHPELLASGGGLLFEAGNVKALAEAMLRLVNEPGLGRRLAKEIPPPRSIEDHVQDLNEIYLRVHSGRGRVSDSTAPLRGALFLDRDGVINRDSPDYIRSLEDWHPLPGSLEAIARLSKAGYRVIVVTNQSGLARNLIRPQDLEQIHAELEARVSALGGRIEGILICEHLPTALCECRKPRTGLLDRARREFGVGIEGAPFVGDRESDLMAARAAGCRPLFVRSGNGWEDDLDSEWDDVPRFADLAAVADRLLDEGDARQTPGLA